MIALAMTEHVRKHDNRHDGALLTLSNWSNQRVASTASEGETKHTEESKEDKAEGQDHLRNEKGD